MGIDKQKGLLTAAAERRRQAKERLHSKSAEQQPSLTVIAAKTLFREAEVYEEELEVQNTELRRVQEELETQQVELELQNDELRRAQDELELSRNTYAELYDFSPIGYFIFDAFGVIQEVNLTGAQLLGLERGLLVEKPFIRYIADAEGRETFSHHLE